MTCTVKTLLTLLLPAGILCLGSCTKNTSANPAGNDTTINGKRPGQKNVYILGYTHDSMVYWKNDTPVLIEKSPGAYDYTGVSMAVSGGHIYICGNGDDFSTSPPAITPYMWVDGVRSKLPDNSGAAAAAAIAVNGTDVYVAGSRNPLAGGQVLLWKNGVESALDSPSIYSEYASSICLSGSDVYVLGGDLELFGWSSKTDHYAEYWKNGVAHSLDSGLVDTSGVNILLHPETYGMFVNGNDVYACGIAVQSAPGQGAIGTQAVYWKNGIPNYLPNTTPDGSAYCIAVAGDTVYVGGDVNLTSATHAAIWTNGVATVLSTNTSTVYGIAVSGNDVYAAGYEYINGIMYATYWLNGVATHLGPTSNATAIVVQ